MESFTLVNTFLLVLSAALAGGTIAKKLKLPMVLGYIAGGFVVGNLLPWVVNRSMVDSLSQWGVTLLLFTIGVEFSFHRLRRQLGNVAWAAAAQIVLCFVLFLFLFLTFGFPFLAAIFLAAAGSLSSTAVVIKILSERGQLSSVPGEITTGWLIVQDLAVVPMMLLLAALASGADAQAASWLATLGSVLLSLGKAAVVLVAASWLARRGVPKLLGSVATLKSHEIFLLTVVGIVFLAAVVSMAMGLSGALGAFLAGLIVAETGQNHAVFAEVRPLRDLFSVVFFVSLGMVLPAQYIGSQILTLAGLTGIILFVKWFIVMGLVRYIGHHRKVAFTVAVSLTQMSEFGFILAHEGLTSRALTYEQYVTLASLTFLTIAVSSPLLSRTQDLYMRFRSVLRYIPKFFPEREDLFVADEGLPLADHVVICGYGRVGRYIGRALEMAGIPFVVVDYNQREIASLEARGMQAVYGDPADRGVLDFAQVDRARLLVVAIPDRHTQEMVIANAQLLNRKIHIICRTHHEEDQKRLKALGVHTVVQPEFEAALTIVTKLFAGFGISGEDAAGKVSRLKIEHGVG